MKTKTLTTLLTVTLGLVGVGAYVTLTNAGAAADGPTIAPSAAAPAPADLGSSTRVNVKALVANLEFLGDKPALNGHPVLIEFWATWCPPCRASIAHLNDLITKYHSLGLEIVGVTGEDKTVVERFRARTAMDYAVALDKDQSLATEFQVRTIPHAWLFDKGGQVVWSGHPMDLDEQTIAGLLPSHRAT